MNNKRKECFINALAKTIKKGHTKLVGWLVGWLDFMAYQPL